MTMNKVKTLDDLKKMRESLRASLDQREKSNTPDTGCSYVFVGAAYRLRQLPEPRR